MKEFVFFCLGAIVAIFVMEGIRLAVETRQKILRDYVLDNYKVKNMRLFDEWLGRLSWREISSYKKKHKDKRVHIILDHMFSHDNYTVFMITMRIGSQGIPLWFRCFKDKDDPEAFKEELLIEGINYIHHLFSKDFDLIFLADR